MHRLKAEIMDGAAVMRAVNRISYEIIEKNLGASDVVLAGIKTRGQFIAERIARKIGELEGKTPPLCGLDISAFRDDAPLQKRGEAELPRIDGIEKKTVIIVDDVLYTGRSARAAMEMVLHTGRARRIQLAVLIDRGHRELPVRPDYIGKNVPTSADEKVKVLMSEIDGRDCVQIYARNEA